MSQEPDKMRNLKTTGSPLPAFAGPIVCLGLIALLAISAARQGISNYAADRAILSGSEALAADAISYQPQNPYAHKSLGMILLRNKDYERAAEAFENAVKLSENDFLLWVRIGICREKSGQFDAAEAAYRKAIVLAPRYGEPKNNLGLMLFENGRYDAAFPLLSEAAANDIDLYPKLLDMAGNVFGNDASAIENAVRPSSLAARKIVTRYMIGRDLMTENVRSFLLNGDLDTKDKSEFIRSLIDKRNFQMARDVWLTTLDVDAGDPKQLMFDGGFEKTNQSDEFGFGWKIDQKATALAVTVSEKEAHSGTRSVRLKFAGNVELGRPLISQLTSVSPRRKYRLTFFFRSVEMISAGLPAVVVSDAVTNQTLARSAAIQTTQAEWKESVVEFAAADAPAVVISLQRPSCNTSPCALFGELILDDFSLVEIRK